MKKKYAYFVNGGIELRMYFTPALSSFADNAILYHTLDDENYLIDYLDDYPVELKKLKSIEFISYHIFDIYYLSALRARERLLGLSEFKLYSNSKEKPSLKDFLIGNSFSLKVLKFITNHMKKKYINKNLLKQLQEDGITDIILCGYTTPEIKSVILTANRLGIKSWSLVHSWKDVYINGYLLSEISGLFVWNDSMKIEYIKRNKHIGYKNIYTVGNPRMDIFYNKNYFQSFEYYQKKYKLKQDGINILYTCVNPRIITDEKERILSIYNIIKKDITKNFNLLIKINPMDNDEDSWYKFFVEYQNISIMDSNWIWDPINEVNYPTYNAEKEWQDILLYSDIVINIASTVTLEALLMNKPVLNVAIDNKLNKCIVSYKLSQSPFYKYLLDNPCVEIATNVSQFKNYFHNLLRYKRVDCTNLDKIVIKWDKKLFYKVLGI